MFHFLAKLGRKPWTKMIVPLGATTSFAGYIGFHALGHKFIGKYLAAESDIPGKSIDLSEDLQKLITSVYDEVKDMYTQPIFELKIRKDPIMRWFAASTLEPVNIGFTDLITGVTIGLPSYYNYKEVKDLPDSIFEIRKVKFFKSLSQKTTKDESLERMEAAVGTDSDNSTSTGPVVRIKKDTEIGKSYINSLLLSDDAKRFSLAREIFYADSFRPLLIGASMTIATLFSLSAARWSIMRYRLESAHVSQRLPIYSFSVITTVIMFNLLRDNINSTFVSLADKKAICINESYRQGAIEYFNKIIMRNKALREEVEGMDRFYDSNGNIIRKRLTFADLPYTERLQVAIDGPTEEMKKEIGLK